MMNITLKSIKRAVYMLRRVTHIFERYTHEHTQHTSSSSLRVARGTAEVNPALRFVAAIVWMYMGRNE